MEGQGVAASAASAAGGRGESGPELPSRLSLTTLPQNHVTGDIADGGEDRGKMGMTVT